MKFRAITDTTKIVRKYNRIILQQDKTNDSTFVLYDNSGHNLLKDIIIPNHSQIDTVQPYNIKLEWTTIDNLHKTNKNNTNVDNPEEIPYGVMGGNWFLNKNDGKIIFEDNPHDINEEFFSYTEYSEDYNTTKLIPPTDIKLKTIKSRSDKHILLLTFFQYIGKTGLYNLDAEKLYTLDFQNQDYNKLTYNHIIVGGYNDELRKKILLSLMIL